VVKFDYRQDFFCQLNLLKLKKLLYNGVVLIFLIMAGMRMKALAAGLGAALAAGPDDANAQATELVVPLETGGEVVFDMRDFGFETQAGIMDRLTACIQAGEKPRDVCVGNVALELQTERLGVVVRETRAVLQPLEEEIGIPMQDLIREPVFCEYAPEPSGIQACAGAVETARLAGLDFRIAEARSLRLAREAEAAGLAAEAEAGRERVAELAAQAEANRAVLSVLQQIAAEEAGQAPPRPSGS
jgi:hypothetical protein